MVRKKKNKRAKKAKKKARKKEAPKPPPPAPAPTQIPARHQKPESITDKIRSYIELLSRRKLKQLAEKPLPSTMSVAEIEDELRELLGE